MTLQFHNVPGPLRLPHNYLPTAFKSLGSPDCATDAVFPLIPVQLAETKSMDPPAGKVIQVSQKELCNPSALTQKINPDPGNFYIGPEMTDALDLNMTATTMPTGPGDVEVIGIVDFGIAFWNDRFCYTADGITHSRFVDVGFLDFKRPGGGASGVEFMTPTGVAQKVAQSKTPGGEREIVNALAVQYPNSAYGQHPQAGQIFSREGINHGTAMADFAGGREPETVRQGHPVPRPFMFGIELPTDAVLDSSGETLQAVLNVAVLALMDQVAQWARDSDIGTPDLKIVVSYAFLGGPNDGSHPVLENLESIMDAHPLSRAGVSLFLPTGNHLQGQLHARLQAEETLRWFLSPDDFGSNTVEMITNDVASFSLHLAHPDGRKAAVTLEPGGLSHLMDEGRLIGAVTCRKIDNGMLKTRLTLGATTPRARPMPLAASGEWSLSLSGKEGKLEGITLWILREDGVGLTRRTPPSRQSRFRDINYKRRSKNGQFITEADLSASPQIRRQGTASLLATGSFNSSKPVGALERTQRNATGKPAWYSGLFADKADPLFQQLVDDGRPGLGSFACGNGGARKFRISGTSVAAAKQARQR